MKYLKNIPDEYKSIIDKITGIAVDNGYVIYAVGGFVRDMVLNRIPKDLDIMVEGDNGGIKFAVLLSQKLKIHPPVIFEKFATAKLIIDNQEIEFIMPRQEYYDKNSRNPRTEKGTLEQDVLRRDFTVNALFLRLNDMALLDLTGRGFNDIRDKVIRVTDETASDLIFEQDPLRILRAVRQSFQLGFKIEKNTYLSMSKKADRITIISPERIRDEINKILVFEKPSEAFYMLDDIKLLGIIFPELKEMQKIKLNGNAFDYAMNLIDKIHSDLALRMTALFYYSDCCGQTSGVILRNVLSRLKYSSDFIKKSVSLLEGCSSAKQYEEKWTDAEIRKFEKQTYINLKDIETFVNVDSGQEKKSLFERIKVLEKNNMLVPKKELLDGNEMSDIFGYPSGKWIGKAKKYIESLQFENPLISKEKAIEELKLYIEKSKDILL